VIPVLDYRLVAETILQDEYSILNSKHFIGIHGYIIVYSVTSRQSFDMVRVIRDKILNHLVSYRPSQN
jgi:Ras family protein